MIPDEVLDVLYCALSTDNHIIESPITMSCGHSMCTDCISKQPQPFICLRCGTEHKIDLANVKKSAIFDVSFQSYSDDLFNYITNKFEKSVQVLKAELDTINERIDAHIESLTEQISLRTEILKAQLSQLKQKFISELKEKKKEMESQISKISIEQHFKEIEKYKEHIEKKYALTEKQFYECQEKIKAIYEITEDLKNYDPKVITFRRSDLVIDRSYIGIINLNSIGKLTNRIRSNEQRVHATDYTPCSLCLLGNGKILVCDNTNKRLVLLNENYKIMRTIDKINNQPFTSLGITTDINNNIIYISDYQNHKIYSLDLEFNQINTFGDKAGNGDDELQHPYDIFFYENLLYVCDCRNQRIKILTSDLKHKETHDVNYQPWQIKITNNMACIRANNSNIYFYELTYFKLRYKYEDHDGPICVFNSYFYEYSDKHKKLYCYDRFGQLDEEVYLDFGKDVLHTSFRINIINNEFVTSAQRKFIII